MKLFNWGSRKNDEAPKQFHSTPLVDAIAAEQAYDYTPLVTRDEALSVPGVMKARNTLTIIATLPLKTLNSKWNQVDNKLFRQIDPDRTNIAVLSDTIEDLFLYKYAYWRVLERETRGIAYPVSAEYIEFHRVSEEEKDGEVRIRIDGKLVSWSDVIKFESPNPGFLRHGGRVVKRALDIDKTSAKYARNPRPLDYFRPTEMADPDEETIRDTLRKWKLWLNSETTGYVPAGLEYITVEQPTPAELQLIEAQNQVNLSIALMTGLDPDELGYRSEGMSRTYNNIQDLRIDRVNGVYAPYMRAITDRLSMADVTRKGHTVQFDLSDFLKADDKTRAEVQAIRLGNDSLTLDEVRDIEHMPPLPEGVTNETRTE